jgi:predicted lipoprotein with Yx(FWY)xxD motif
MTTRKTTTERTTRSKYARRGASLAVGVAAVLALAACGSSGSKATVSPGAQPAAAAASGSTSAALVKIGSSTSAGSVLVDSNGMTLYTLKNNGTPVACTGACAAAWPPLVLPAGSSSAVGAQGVTGLSTMMSADGTQVTENGAPLYRFKGDKAPGDTNGKGLASFGGTWDVSASTAAASAPAATTPAPAATTPTTSSSGGYGY